MVGAEIIKLDGIRISELGDRRFTLVYQSFKQIPEDWFEILEPELEFY